MARRREIPCDASQARLPEGMWSRALGDSLAKEVGMAESSGKVRVGQAGK